MIPFKGKNGNMIVRPNKNKHIIIIDLLNSGYSLILAVSGIEKIPTVIKINTAGKKKRIIPCIFSLHGGYPGVKTN
jgi:hypothetical protein